MFSDLAFSLLTLLSLGQAGGLQRMVIDTDPGIDDILSLFVALGDPDVEVIAITLVRGNTDIGNVINNTLHTLNVAKKLSVPVYVGSKDGLVESPFSDRYFGSNGLADIQLPRLNINKKLEDQAATYLANIVKQFPGEITIMALGPLTNIALAIHLNPKFLNQAREVITLGGSIRGQGNVAPGVEFNIYIDAAASSFVFNQSLASSKVISLVPWETVIDNDLGWDWRWNVLGKIKNPVVDFLNKIEYVQQKRMPEPAYTPADVYALGVALSKNYVVKAQRLFASVEYRGQKSQGVVLVDYTNITGNSANLDIITEVNTSILRNKIINNLRNF